MVRLSLLASLLAPVGILLLAADQPDPVFGIAVGIVTSLPALVPGIQRLAQNRPSARAKTLFILGFLSVAVSLGLFARIETEAMRVSVDMANLMPRIYMENGGIRVEHGASKDYYPPGAGQELWSLAGTSLSSLVTTSLLAWHFTRRKDTQVGERGDQ
jgi:hypothetical protein